MAKERYDVVRSSKGDGFLVWDNNNFDFVRTATGAVRVFEDETAAYVFIDSKGK
jgi:hypothetical protein